MMYDNKDQDVDLSKNKDLDGLPKSLMCFLQDVQNCIFIWLGTSPKSEDLMPKWGSTTRLEL